MSNLHHRILVSLLVVVGVVSALQGWRNYRLDYDEIVNRLNAYDLIHDGALPETSGLSSFGSYNPPGSSWTFVPTTYLGDPRLDHPVGGAILLLITVLGLYLVLRRVAGREAALLGIGLYILSALGLYFGATLWHRARPFTYIWMMYFSVLWVEKRDPRFLAAALSAYGIGLYVFFEMIPAVAGLGVLWLRYKPPVKVKWLLIAAAFQVLVWYPYARFEAGRDFADVRSLLTLTDIGPDREVLFNEVASELQSWDPQTESLGQFDPLIDNEPKDSHLLKKAFFAAYNLVRNLASNLLNNNPLGILLIPYLFVLGFAYLAGHPRFPTSFFVRYGPAGGWALLVAAVVANEWSAGAVYGRSLDGQEASKIRVFQAALAVAAMGLIFIRPLGRRVQILMSGLFASIRRFPLNRPAEAALLFSITVWLAFAPIASVEKYQWGMWPLQVVAIALAVTYIPARLEWPKSRRLALVGLAAVSLCINGEGIGKLKNWLDTGYGGQVPEMIEIVDHIAGLSGDTGSTPVAVGFHLFFNGHEYVNGFTDDRYAIGSQLSNYLFLRYGTATKELPPKGFSNGDLYRVVETEPRPNKPHRFKFSSQSEYVLILERGPIQLWRLSG